MMSIEQKIALIKSSIESVPDTPKVGILFRDITTLLEKPDAFSTAVELLAEHYQKKGITKIVGIEARGFLFGAPIALRMRVGFVPVRKPGKLPRATYTEHYELEYGTDTLELHCDSLGPDDKVLVIDDLLATGGTVEAAIKLIRRTGAEVKDAAFVITLPDLSGEERLNSLGITCYSLVSFPGH